MPGRALAFFLVFAAPLPAVAADEPVSIAVMEFTSKGGVTQDQMDALSDMLSNQIRSMGNYEVIGKSDIRSMLTMEEQRQRLSTCNDQSCLAEIGGALGARWVVVGNVSLFGKTYLLNLKLIDVEGASVASGISRSITGGEDKLLAELPGAARELLDAVADRLSTAAEEKQTEGEKTGLAREEERTVPARGETQWFNPPADRSGRWSVWALGGLQLFFTAKLDGEDESEVDHFTFLDGNNWGLTPHIGAGYGLTDWLCLFGQVGGFYSFVGSDSGSEFGAVEPALGLKISLPLGTWIRPVFDLALGFSYMLGSTDEDISALGLMFDFGVGLDLHFTQNWFLEGRLGGRLRYYRDFTWGEYEKSVTATVFGVVFALLTGWQF
jgi:TolB-like protein